MKAVWVTRFGPFEDIEVAEVPDPVPGPGEVLLEVGAAEANYPDLLVVEGRYQIKPKLPFSPGKAAAGTVIALGHGTTGLAVGDRVSAQVEYGAYAQRLRAPAINCFALPEGVGFPEAAALGLTYQTSYFALVDRARLQNGETVLVLGASGGIGVSSIQLAKALGASAVLGAVRTEAEAAVARSAGADGVIMVGGDLPLRDLVRDEAARLLDGRGVDVVIDPVGGALGSASLRALAWCGRMVVIGFTAGEPPEIRANYLLVKNISVHGLQWSDYRDRAPARVQDVQQTIFRLLQAGRINPVIAGVLPLTQFRDALRALRDGTVHGKLILDPAR
jgi:NADPH:quinone reductase